MELREECIETLKELKGMIGVLSNTIRGGSFDMIIELSLYLASMDTFICEKLVVLGDSETIKEQKRMNEFIGVSERLYSENQWDNYYYE